MGRWDTGILVITPERQVEDKVVVGALTSRPKSLTFVLYVTIADRYSYVPTQ